MRRSFEWLDNQIRATRSEPQRLCFQVPEDVAAIHLIRCRRSPAELREPRFRFALERFGSGRDPLGILEAVPIDFVKIDGALVQGLTGDQELQQRVRLLVERPRNAHRDHRRTRRGCQHHGRAVADRRAVHPGLLRHEPEEIVLRS